VSAEQLCLSCCAVRGGDKPAEDEIVVRPQTRPECNAFDSDSPPQCLCADRQLIAGCFIMLLACSQWRMKAA
jgi:hypothetical protein